MNKVKLYEVSYKDVMAADYYDIMMRRIPEEMRLTVDGASGAYLLNCSNERVRVPIHRINKITNGHVSEDLIAIHPDLAEALLPDIMGQACSDEYERLREWADGLNMSLAKTKFEKDNLEDDLNSMRNMSFLSRLKFLIRGRVKKTAHNRLNEGE